MKEERDIFTKNIINFGIGFEAGRANVCNLINTYYKDMVEQASRYKTPVKITIFLMYDLQYQGAKEEDFYNIKPEVFKAIDLKYITKEDIENAKKESQNFLTKQESDLFFGYGHAKGRNTIMYFALKENIDYLMFWDDDEYPMACLKEGKSVTWKKQDNILIHLKAMEHSTISHGYHCGYVSPIPYVEFGEDISEESFKNFIEAISNEVISWDSIKQKMLVNYGITYADKDLSDENGLEYVMKDKWVVATNLCLNLNKVREIPAFYNPPNARGEDTFFSTKLGKAKVVKIPVYHFHDGFLQYTGIMENEFPKSLSKIKMNSAKIEKRFYKACIGWARYKPMLMYVTNKENYLQNSEIMVNKLNNSIDNMNRLIKHSDCDFRNVLEEFKAYSSRVVLDYQDYQKINRIWNKIKKRHVLEENGFITINKDKDDIAFMNQTIENI